MNKVLKKVGLSAVVATFVFGLASTSSALVPQDPDNETANITANADVFVEATNDATYSETEDYSLVLDNNTYKGGEGKTKLVYTKDFKATNGQAHVVSNFAAVGSADASTPNIKASNKITFNTLYEGLNAGTFTGTEKIQYQRCQPELTPDLVTFCTTTTGATLPKAEGDVAAGSTFDVQYAAITTGADVTAVGDIKKVPNPNLNYNIDARGLGVIAQNDNAIGSVAAGMKADITEEGGTTMAYEQHTQAKGLVKFTKTMKYNSVTPNSGVQKTNIDKVP